jgi:hypothetical protein
MPIYNDIEYLSLPQQVDKNNTDIEELLAVIVLLTARIITLETG